MISKHFDVYNQNKQKLGLAADYWDSKEKAKLKRGQCLIFGKR